MDLWTRAPVIHPHGSHVRETIQSTELAKLTARYSSAITGDKIWIDFSSADADLNELRGMRGRVLDTAKNNDKLWHATKTIAP